MMAALGVKSVITGTDGDPPLRRGEHAVRTAAWAGKARLRGVGSASTPARDLAEDAHINTRRTKMAAEALVTLSLARPTSRDALHDHGAGYGRSGPHATADGVEFPAQAFRRYRADACRSGMITRDEAGER